MATHHMHHTDEQRRAQGKLLAQLFGLPDDSNITENWSMESANDGALLKIELARYIDRETAEALINGSAYAKGEK